VLAPPPLSKLGYWFCGALLEFLFNREMVCCFVCSVQSGVSQHQSATEGALGSSNMSVRSAAAAGAAGVHSQTSSSSSDTHRSSHVISGSSPDTAGLLSVILTTAQVILLAIQFAARQMRRTP